MSTSSEPLPNVPRAPDQPPTTAEQPNGTPDSLPEITIDATYQDGVLRPNTPLDLPPDTVLHVRMVPRPVAAPATDDDGAPASEQDTPREKPRILLLVPLLGALLLGALAQYMLLEQGEFSWMSAGIYLCAALLFAWTVASSERAWWTTSTTEAGPAWKWATTGIAIALSLWVTWTLFEYRPGMQDAPPTLTWVAAWLLLLITWVRLPGLASIRDWLKTYRLELATVATVTLAAAVLRLWGLASMPFTLSGDEGSIGMEVRRVLEGEIRNPFLFGWGPAPTLSFYVHAVPPALLGDLNPWTLRLTSALFGILAIPAVYLLTRLLFDWRTALVAAILLAGYELHLHFSRVAILVIQDSLLYTFTLALLVYGLRYRPHPGVFVLTGLVAGFTQYFYAGGRLLPIIMLAFLVYLWIFQRSWLTGQHINLALLGVTLLVVSGPMIRFAIDHPDIYNARFNQVGIVQSGWLEDMQSSTDQSTPQILFDQLQYALLGFGVYEDRADAFAGGTLANPLLALLLFLGIGLGLLNWWKKPAFALLFLWFWGALLGGMVLTVNPPSSNRMGTLTAVAVILAAVALAEIVRLLFVAAGMRAARHWMLVSACVLALPVAFIDVRAYFGEYIPQNRFGNVHAHTATLLGYDLAPTADDAHLYFFGPPHMWSNFSTLVFLAPRLERTDVPDPLSQQEEVTTLVEPQNNERDLVFIFLPHRTAEFDLVQAVFPQGNLSEVLSSQGTLLFYKYTVPQQQLATPRPAASAPN